jgi:dynein heavy chain, axonemal
LVAQVQDEAQIPSHRDALFTRDQQKAVAIHCLSQRRQLPPAINSRALFTKAAPYGDLEDPMFHSTCNRIGSNYSPSAAVLAAALFEEYPADPRAIRRPSPQAFQGLRSPQLIKAHAGHNLQQGVAAKPIHSTASRATARSRCNVHRPPFEPEELCRLAESLQRFYFYLEDGIDASHIAPYRSEWIQNALSLLPQSERLRISQEAVQSILQASVEEMKDDYVHAMRRAIMQYIIKNPIERRCELVNAWHTSAFTTLRICQQTVQFLLQESLCHTV